MLDAGIDVFSTLNVQHIESLNDQLAEHSGVRVRETLPDQALQRADEIVMIDVTPEALLQRLRDGKVYPRRAHRRRAQRLLPDREPHALRETALRQVAEEVVAKRIVRPWSIAARPSASGCSRSSSPNRARNASSAAPGAARNGSAPTSTSSGSSRRAGLPKGRQAHALSALRQLTSVLGANLIVRESDDVVEAAADEIRQRGTTYVLSASPHPGAASRRLREPLPQRIMHAAPRGVDVRIVAARREK